MDSFYEDSHIKIYQGNALELLRQLPENHVQCCVTSPPYWGLRKYEGEQDLIWGGNKECKHEWQTERINLSNHNGEGATSLTGSTGVSARGGGSSSADRGFCSLCGAWRGAYGLEPSIALYVQHSIEILREIRRVLRPDGVCWWNIGDSYATHASGGKGYSHNFRSADIAEREGIDQPKPTAKSMGLKEKDLCLIPFRVALEAQADGWWVRSDIIWSKNNPMPESVTDRPTESHEHILMLTKSARYYYDQEAVKESSNGWNGSRFGDGKSAAGEVYHRQSDHGETESSTGRNLRSVWTFPTQSFKGAHFATFPEELPERCIKAATPEYGSCPECGKPWERIVGSKPNNRTDTDKPTINGVDTGIWNGRCGESETKTLGWQPGCKCNKPPVPALVLDPFSGSGTTLWVAKRLNRHAIGFDLSKEYCGLATDRNKQQVLL